MSEEASLDAEYLAMLVAIENKVEFKDLDSHYELRSLSGCKENISVAELTRGHRLILKGGEIFVPKSLWSQILENLHVTHSSDTYMIMQTKGKIWWPSMKADIKDFFKKCSECLEFRRSKAQRGTEISYENLFENFEPGQQVQCDLQSLGARLHVNCR